MALLGKWGSSADGFQQQVNPTSYVPETVEAEVVEPAEAGGQKWEAKACRTSMPSNRYA